MVNTPLTPDDLGLKGRQILVTGAAQGIGRATAVWLARLGADVVATDIQDVSETLAECGDTAQGEKLDLADFAAGVALVERLDAAAPLYGVVNCAGLLMRRPLDEITADEVELMAAVNQFGTFHLARAALRLMSARKEGRIVLYTSQGAFSGGLHGSTAYAMNKAAVTALMKSLARMGGAAGVTVNAVAPGAADTAMMRGGMTDEMLEQFRQAIPVGRYATPDELAAPTTFLLSRWAGYITGTTLHVNGGQLMV